ncbi:MAG: exodeoxyribonuclease V subunit alpha [Desulfobacteraceae bacterium]|nr:exodeoxyribonuclease V subunit alpha [Desulfobacteraceae bacterium]
MDLHFAEFISRIAEDDDPDIHLAAALVSRCTTKGDSCLDLRRIYSENEGRDGPDRIRLPALSVWMDKLAECRAVGEPGQFHPLILDNRHRLYLYRYWAYENTIIDGITKMIENRDTEIDHGRLAESFHRFFSVPGNNTGVDWQQVAVFMASMKKFCVISGGPGTGKTTTVATILAVLIENAAPTPLNIYLCAPTGKASVRLKEAMIKARESLNCGDYVKANMPVEAGTIHRLLRPIPGSPYFRFDQSNPLPADVVIVDEASMVDLALMAKLIRALQHHTRLILVGDKDQLSSVEAGSVLGDICNRDTRKGFTKRFGALIESTIKVKLPCEDSTAGVDSDLHDHIVSLEKNYRFNDHSGIGALSRAVRRMDANKADELLKDRSDTSISFKSFATPGKSIRELGKQIVSGYTAFMMADDPVEALDLFHQFKVLCVVKKGAFGVAGINRVAEGVLSDAGLIPHRPQANPWYQRRPVMITSNDYRLGLFNGDIGITWYARDERSAGYPQVYFSSDAGDIRRFSPYRLPAHETVYAMTAHKSQGSEFDHVNLVLPENDTPLLTCELIYTAITRARKTVVVWGDEAIFSASVQRRIHRSSGLRDALWKNPGGL